MSNTVLIFVLIIILDILIFSEVLLFPLLGRYSFRSTFNFSFLRFNLSFPRAVCNADRILVIFVETRFAEVISDERFWYVFSHLSMQVFLLDEVVLNVILEFVRLDIVSNLSQLSFSSFHPDVFSSHLVPEFSNKIGKCKCCYIVYTLVAFDECGRITYG